jgi:osmotically-inducible protein OsmY
MRYILFSCAFAVIGLLGTGADRVLAVAPPSDSDVNFWVQDAMGQDPRLDDFEITSTTRARIVTLTGTVDNLAAKRYAVREAKKIKGVKGVIDQLLVEPRFLSDIDIVNAVRRRILNSSVIKSQRIVVTCNGGVVSLSGFVDSYSEEQQAGLLASEVGGVKSVKNNILTEWKAKRSDEEIKGDVTSALDRDVYLTGLPIVATVTDGIVHLTGNVGNAYEKDRAEEDVRWISNVSDVKDNLSVEWYDNEGVRKEKAWPDEEQLQQAVRTSLDDDSRLAAYDTTVVVQYGHVTLSGRVSSHYEKRIAEEDAKNVVGVGWVTNNLIVRNDQREDWAIQDDIDFNLSTDAILKSFDLSANVVNGNVTLTGAVTSWPESSHAYDVASSVLGVKSVVNNIVVNRERWKTDTELVQAIKKRIKKNWTTWWVDNKINVTVKNGVATLEGNVNTWAERNEAGDLALHTIGIYKIDNRLTVKGYDYPWEEYQTK